MKLDKIKKYGWTLRDQPGRLVWIDKTDLKIDRTYQRDFSEKRANRMAADWSWIACGTLTVADRQGEFYVIVGQHRLGAAMKRSDIDTLPCNVFESDGLPSEAAGFLSEAMERKGVDWLDQVRARVVANDQIAIRLVELIESVGRVPHRSSGPKTVACLGLIYRELSADAELAEGIFRLSCLLSDGIALDSRLVAALCYAERHLSEDVSFYKRGKLRDRVIRLGAVTLLDEILRASAFYKKGGPRIWASAIVETVNKGMRVNRVSLLDDKKEP